VWWLAVAGRIDHTVARLAPHAKALACCCLHEHSKCRRVLLRWSLVGRRRCVVERWAAALARGWRLAALGLAQPHAPPARLLPVGPQCWFQISMTFFAKEKKKHKVKKEKEERSQETWARRHVAHAFGSTSVWAAGCRLPRVVVVVRCGSIFFFLLCRFAYFLKNSDCSV